MKIENIIPFCNLKALTEYDGGREYCGVYAGDLLSRAMSHVEEDNLWITIMNNVNVIAVASLTGAAAVILAEGVTMTDEVLSVAKEKEITVFSSDKTVFELCVILGKDLSDE